MDVYLQCPACGNESFERIPRKLWMRLIPSSRYFSCYLCSHTQFCGNGESPEKACVSQGHLMQLLQYRNTRERAQTR